MIDMIKKYSILFLLLLLCGIVGQAQTLVFEQSFTQFADLNDDIDYLNGEDLSVGETSFMGWTFDNCSARKNGNLRVGNRNGEAPGSVTTQSFDLSGNALIALRMKLSNSEKNDVTFNVSSNTGTLRKESFTITPTSSNKTYMFGLPAYLLSGGTSTRLTISIAAKNAIFIESIRVYDIGNAIFYESFDCMVGRSGMQEFYDGNNAQDYLFDNSECTISGDVKQASQNLYFGSGTPIYNLPIISYIDESDYLLTFRMSKFGSSGSSIFVGCSGSAKITPFNTRDFANLKTSQTANLIDEPERYWQDYSTVITGMTNTTLITFGGNQYNIDNVLLTPIPVTFDEAVVNATNIEVHNGITTDVELRRTLTANVWCPLCLPFDVTPESFATAANDVVADANPVLRTFTSVSEGVFTFGVVPAATTIAAGTPFLVKVTKQVTNPTFANVTVVNTPAGAVPANSDYQFVGTYSPVNLNTDGTHLFLGTDGILYKPGTAAGYNHMNGLRAYFQIPAAASGTRISLPGDETTAIQDINDDGYQYEHRFDSEAVRTQNLLPRQITIREGRKYLSK